MACRRAPALRSAGRANLVEAEVKREVKAREPMWEAAGLALPDQRMASAGPAMEVVGRYSEVLDNLGDPVAPDRYLLVARRAVDEAAAIEIDHLPLETFDIRTRFALAWVRDYRLEVAMLRGVLTEVSKGVRLSTAAEFNGHISEASSVIDVALALAKAWPEGLDAVGEILVASQRSTDDPFLWAAMKYLSSRLPEADPDAIAWTELVRGRRAIGTATREFASVKKRAEEEAQAQSRQGTLFDFTDTDTEGQ
jgi:putative DNA methylase